MQALLASLVTSLDVKDAAFKSGMATARAEVRKTGQDFDRSADQMSSALDRVADSAERAFQRVVDAAHKVAQNVRNTGLALTAAITLPATGMAAASNAAAQDFEAAMNRVHSALVNASPEQLEKLRNAALTMGPAVGKSAIEAAAGIEDLAKNGLSAADILSGGLKSALTLSVVGQTELGTAAAATTDILHQFGKSTAELPTVVDKVSGALDVSKMGFDDYKLAIGQVGGVAGGLGISFDDMNTALAATASYFDSGSDAGTSFKTFLLSFNPISADATRTMDKLGIKFFDASGKALTLAQDAEILKTKLAGLNDKTLRDALNNMFGADGMRTAIALMKQGAAGIADVQAQIDKVTADQKTSILLDGEAAAAQRMATAWQNLKVEIGDAGILQAMTAIKGGIADVLGVLGSAPPWFYKLAVGVSAAAASVGPLILVGGTLAKLILPLLLLRLGPVALAFSALVNPVGVIIRLLGQLALQAGAATMLGMIGSRLVAFAGPIGIAISLLTIFVPLLMKTATASDAMQAATDAAREAQAKATDIATRLATATGKAKDETLKLAEAQRVQAVVAVQNAKNNMLAARAAFAAAQANLTRSVQNAATGGIAYGSGGSGAGAAVVGASNASDQAKADYKASQDALRGQLDALGTLDGAIKQAQAPSAPGRDIDFSKSKTGGRGGRGRDTSADQADFDAKLAEAQQAQLDAQAELTGSVQARYRADMARIAADRKDYEHQLQADQGITSAQADILMAQKDKELGIRRQIAEQELTRGLYQQEYEIAKAQNDTAQELAQADSDLAETVAQRREAEEKLLRLRQKAIADEIENTLRTADTSSSEYQAALDKKASLPALFAKQQEETDRANESDAQKYMRTFNTTHIPDDLEKNGVQALQDLNTQLTDAILGAGSLAKAFENMGKRIVASLIDIAIQQTLIKPLATSLFGGSGGGGLFGSIGGLLSSAFGGGKAKGGAISPSNWYVVGEEGPEIFAPGTSGTIIPNGGMGSGRAGPVNFDLRGAVMTSDLLVQMKQMAAQSGGQAYSASVQHTNNSLRNLSRQRL